MILCETGIALHRLGWGSKHIDHYMDVLQEVEDEISADHSKSSIQLLEEETGIELKMTADGKS